MKNGSAETISELALLKTLMGVPELIDVLVALRVTDGPTRYTIGLGLPRARQIVFDGGLSLPTRSVLERSLAQALTRAYGVRGRKFVQTVLETSRS